MAPATMAPASSPTITAPSGLQLGNRLLYMVHPLHGYTCLSTAADGSSSAQVTFVADEDVEYPSGPPTLSATLTLTREGTRVTLKVDIDHPGPSFTGSLIRLRGGGSAYFPGWDIITPPGVEDRATPVSIALVKTSILPGDPFRVGEVSLLGYFPVE